MKPQFDLETTEFSLVNARACAAAAKAAYGKNAEGRRLNAELGKREEDDNCEFVECRATSTQALVMACGSAVVVAFRGTQEPLDFLTDAEAWRLNLTGCTVHFGFWKAMMSVFQPVCEAIERVSAKCVSTPGSESSSAMEVGRVTPCAPGSQAKIGSNSLEDSLTPPRSSAGKGLPALPCSLPVLRNPLFVTGHSLGGALAMLFAYRYVAIWGGLESDGDRGRGRGRGRGREDTKTTLNLEPRTLNLERSAEHCSALQVCTFGQPRVGDGNFARLYNRFHGQQTFRVVNDQDIVPRVPGVLLGYRHCGQEALLSAECGVRSAELPEGLKIQNEKLKIGEGGCRVTLNPQLSFKLIRDAWFLWRARRKGPLALAELIRDHHIDSYLRRLGN